MNLRDRRWDPDKDDAAALWSRLNEAWRDLREVIRSIPKLSFYERSFTGPIASLTAGEMGNRPKGVILIDLVNTDIGGTAAVTWSWSWSDGTLTTTAFSGVAAGTYRMRLLVIGGS